jgi:hypothetical protein
VNVYTLYITDDRYSVPTIDILMADADEEVRALAVARLASSPHYLGIEVWVEDRLVCAMPQTDEA